jgi:hypothetical protein
MSRVDIDTELVVAVVGILDEGVSYADRVR